MASAVTLGSMLAEVRRRAGQETLDQANAFVTDPEIRALLNTYLAELYDLLIEANGLSYYRSSFGIATDGQNSTYSLPGDFYKLIAADLQVSVNDVRPLRPYTNSERDRFRWQGNVWRTIDPLYYELQANSINFVPTPSGALSITLSYVPAFVPFLTDGSQDSNNFDSVNGWTDFAIWSAVAAVTANDDADPSFALGQREVWKQRILSLAQDRDLQEPPRVQQVMRRRGGWM